VDHYRGGPVGHDCSAARGLLTTGNTPVQYLRDSTIISTVPLPKGRIPPCCRRIVARCVVQPFRFYKTHLACRSVRKQAALAEVCGRLASSPFRHKPAPHLGLPQGTCEPGAGPGKQEQGPPPHCQLARSLALASPRLKRVLLSAVRPRWSGLKLKRRRTLWLPPHTKSAEASCK
jgi:hypothetical protein